MLWGTFLRHSPTWDSSTRRCHWWNGTSNSAASLRINGAHWKPLVKNSSRRCSDELGKLALMGLCEHGGFDRGDGGESGDGSDSDEPAVPARHHVHAQPRPGQAHWRPGAFRERLDVLARLRRCFPRLGGGNLVA